MFDALDRERELRHQIHKECKSNQSLGRWTHRAYLSLAALTVGSSAVSAVLALTNANRVLVGSMALIPGICAGVSDRFHLLLKKHWYYRKYDKLKALERKMDFVFA